MTGWLAFVTDPTLQRVAIGALLLGVGSGVLGSFAVLREQSLLGDAISHAALPGVCLGFLIAGGRSLPWILAGALATGAAAALLALLLTRHSRLKTDAALGIVLSVFFAVGTVLLSHIQNRADASQAGLESFLFGQAAAILRSDLVLIGAVTAFALLLVTALWKEFKVVTFDPGFAASLGLPVGVLEAVLTAMIALAVVIGLQMVGVVLMAAMVIAPAAAARQWTERLGRMVIVAAVFGAIAGVAGAVVSALGRGLATGPLIVLAATALVIVSLLLAPARGLLWAALQARRNRGRLRRHAVLTTLYRLGEAHGDLHYPTERGMLELLYGGAVAALRRLEADGHVRQVTHMPEEGPHWELTDTGRREARRFLEALEPDAGDRPEAGAVGDAIPTPAPGALEGS